KPPLVTPRFLASTSTRTPSTPDRAISLNPASIQASPLPSVMVGLSPILDTVPYCYPEAILIRYRIRIEAGAIDGNRSHLSRRGLSVAVRPYRPHEHHVVRRQIRRGQLESVRAGRADADLFAGIRLRRGRGSTEHHL